MARLNIEQSLFSDPLFWKLIKEVGNHHEAIGLLIEFWFTAQKYWIKDRSLVPKQVFEDIENHEKLLQTKWAIAEKHGIYARGSEDQFAWIEAKVKAGQRGGLKSAELRKNRHLASSRAKHCSSGANPPTPTPTPTQNIYIAECSEIEQVYKRYPRKVGKGPGIKTLTTKKGVNRIQNKDDFKLFEKAVDNFVKFCELEKREPQYTMYFSTFCNQWRDWIDWVPDKTTGGYSPIGVVEV